MQVVHGVSADQSDGNIDDHGRVFLKILDSLKMAVISSLAANAAHECLIKAQTLERDRLSAVLAKAQIAVLIRPRAAAMVVLCWIVAARVRFDLEP